MEANVNGTEEGLEEKMLRKLKKTFLRSFWKDVSVELPARSGTYWANIVLEGEMCNVTHQDRVYFYEPDKAWFSDSLKKEGGRVSHWAYPLPQPKE